MTQMHIHHSSYKYAESVFDVSSRFIKANYVNASSLCRLRDTQGYKSNWTILAKWNVLNLSVSEVTVHISTLICGFKIQILVFEWAVKSWLEHSPVMWVSRGHMGRTRMFSCSQSSEERLESCCLLIFLAQDWAVAGKKCISQQLRMLHSTEPPELKSGLSRWWRWVKE